MTVFNVNRIPLQLPITAFNCHARIILQNCNTLIDVILCQQGLSSQTDLRLKFKNHAKNVHPVSSYCSRSHFVLGGYTNIVI